MSDTKTQAAKSTKQADEQAAPCSRNNNSAASSQTASRNNDSAASSQTASRNNNSAASSQTASRNNNSDSSSQTASRNNNSASSSQAASQNGGAARLGEQPEEQANGLDKANKGAVKRVWGWFTKSFSKTNVWQKALLLLFAFAIFGYSYKRNVWHRNELAFFAVLFSMVFVYLDILVIRDHLWVIEGSMRESKRWRDVFFNHSALAKQRLRKFLVLVFSAIVFGSLYHLQVHADFAQDSSLAFFVGGMLMITALYYEVLLIRDEVLAIYNSINAKAAPETSPQSKDIAKFMPNETDKSNSNANENAGAEAGFDSNAKAASMADKNSSSNPNSSSNSNSNPNASANANANASANADTRANVIAEANTGAGSEAAVKPAGEGKPASGPKQSLS